jgi:tetratricopeptide (TPR) repeat protein
MGRDLTYSHIWLFACALILLLSALLYTSALSGERVWDDHMLLSGEAIGGGDRLLYAITRPFLDHFFRPLVSVSFFLERRLWHDHIPGYHLTNVLLHLLTTGALIGALHAIFRRRAIALAGGLLFAAQPAQVGAVAWIGGRTDSLCALWMALFIWALARAVASTDAQRFQYLAGAVAAYTAALFTKEQMLAALPLVPLAFRCFPRAQAIQTPGAGWRATVPFLAASLFFLAMGYSLGLPKRGGVYEGVILQTAQFGHTVAYYTLLLLLPSPRWMHTLSLGALEQAGVWSVLFGFGVTTMALLLFMRWLRREPAAAWFLAFVCLTLLPVSNIVPMPFLLVTPYRAGAAGLGVAALLAWGAVGASGVRRSGSTLDSSVSSSPSLPLSPSPPLLKGGFAALFILWCAGLTVWGAAQWRDEIHLMRTMVRYDPQSIVARYVLAESYLRQNRAAEAAEPLEKTLTLLFRSSAWRDAESARRAFRTDAGLRNRLRQNQGSERDPRIWLAMIYSRLGYARLAAGDMRGAEEAYRSGAIFDPDDPFIRDGLRYCAERR